MICLKKVLITGGSGGIAQSVRSLLEKEGYDVFAPSRAEMDVTDPDSVEKAMKAYVPDILINNAGYVVPRSIKEADVRNAEKHIDVNLAGTFYCAMLGLKYNPRLEIFNIGSAAAVETHATWSEYCATKAAVVMATKCWAEDGIFAVCISPGRTRTKMRKSLYPDEDQDTLLDPDDFAKVVYNAVLHKYPAGTHVVVRKQNVQDILARDGCGQDNILPSPCADPEQIARIRRYEAILDKASAETARIKAAAARLEAMRPEIDALAAYYGSDDWKKDFADDESGLLPTDLKRGVFSEDGVWDLLEEYRRFTEAEQEKPRPAEERAENE